MTIQARYLSFSTGWQDTNSQAAREKRARLETFELQGPEGGLHNQSRREEFGRNSRLPPHGRSVMGGGQWAEPRLPHPHPSHARWPTPAHWSEDDNEYDEDGYVVAVHTQNWRDVTFNAPQWQNDGLPYNSPRGRPWGGRGFVSRLNMPQLRYPRDCGHTMDEVYIDRDGYELQHPHRRSMYQEGEHSGYGGAPLRYVDNKPIPANTPSLLPPIGSTHQAHHMASTDPMLAPAHGKEQQPPSTSNVVEDVYSFESFNPESSATKSIQNARDIAQPALSPKKGRRSVQLIYEREEADRIARGQHPFRIECDSAGKPIEFGKAGSRFLEVLRAFCIVYLDISVIKVQDQNTGDYDRLREEVESEVEFFGHPLSDEGFKKAMSRCMKAERSRLHRLYMSRPERECPPKEQADVWERLKAYWSSPKIAKVAKMGSATPHTATTSEGGLVTTGPYSIIPFCTNSLVKQTEVLSYFMSSQNERDQ